MKNQDFTTRFSVDQTPEEVFNAINHVRSWWSENIQGATDQLNSVFRYRYQDVHHAKMKITEQIPNQKIVWHVEENYFKFTEDEKEWTGTDIIFDIREQDGKTILEFTHRGLVPDFECFDLCKDAWTHYIPGSLKDLITTGKGNPTPMEAATHQDDAAKSATKTPSDAKLRICHRLRIDVPVETVFHALTTEEGLSAWWTPDTKAQPVIGSTLKFSFGPDYSKEIRVEDLHHYDKVKWLCLKAQEEWIGTTISFDLEPHPKGTVLSFNHDNWRAYTPEFAGCSYAWALFLRSLKLLCETGKGLPFPEFDKH